MTIYANRAAAVAAWPMRTEPHMSWFDGSEHDLRIVTVVEQTGATDIPDMDDAVPDGDVSPSHFGCIGDGDTDDTQSLQRAELYCRKTFRRLIGNGVYALKNTLLMLAPEVELRLIVRDDFEDSVVVDINWPRAQNASQPLPIDPYMPIDDSDPPEFDYSTVRQNQAGYHRIHIDGRHEPVAGNTAHEEIGFRIFGVRSPRFRGLYTGNRLYKGAVCTNDTEKQTLDFGFWKCRTALTVQRETVSPIGSDTTPNTSFFNLQAAECGQFLQQLGSGASKVHLDVEQVEQDLNLPAVEVNGGHSSVLSGIVRSCDSYKAAILVTKGEDANTNTVHFDNLLIQVVNYGWAVDVEEVDKIFGSLCIEAAYGGGLRARKVTGAMNLTLDITRSEPAHNFPEDAPEDYDGYAVADLRPIIDLGDDEDGDIRSGLLRATVWNTVLATSATETPDGYTAPPRRKALVVRESSIGENDSLADNGGTAPYRAFRVELLTDGTDGGVDILDPRLQTSGQIVANRKVNWRGDATFSTLDLNGVGLSGRISIADDSFVAFRPIQPQGFITVTLAGNTTRYGHAYYNVGSSPSMTMLHFGGNVSATTGALTGTTGTDGYILLSAHSDGKLYVQNRLGGGIGVHIAAGNP